MEGKSTAAGRQPGLTSGYKRFPLPYPIRKGNGVGLLTGCCRGPTPERRMSVVAGPTSRQLVDG